MQIIAARYGGGGHKMAAGCTIEGTLEDVTAMLVADLTEALPDGPDRDERSADGILLVDKPAGVTSFAVVNHVRRALVDAFPELAPAPRPRQSGGPKPPRFKCGHAGTLDPLATGLLMVLVGKGSRLAPFLMGLDKTYAATVRFGTGTDTLDREGQVVGTAPVPDSPEAVTACLAGFRGDIMQIPPVISALKKDGQPLYKLVRSGQDVPEPEARPVTIHQLGDDGCALGRRRTTIRCAEIDLEVGCSSGTYIRSLARDLARAAGSEGHIQELRRLEVGSFPGGRRGGRRHGTGGRRTAGGPAPFE